MPRPAKEQQESKKQAELQAQQEADEKTKMEKELLESAGLTSANADETPSDSTDDISDDGIQPEQEKSNVSVEQEQPKVDEKPVELEKTSNPKTETKKKVKIADHMMKINGVFYQTGDKLPVD